MLGGVVVGKLVKALMPVVEGAGGTVIFYHYTTREGAKAIAESGLIRPGGIGLGSMGGQVYGFPGLAPGYARLLGVKAEEVFVVQVSANSVRQTGMGFLLHRGPINLMTPK